MRYLLRLLLLIMLCVLNVIAQEHECLPLVHEGVKWVNEKVIINHGDTTNYYYNYEFSGYDTITNLSGDINRALYYYMGETLDAEHDSLIAGLRENSYSGFSRVTCYRNNAYFEILDQKRNMLPTPMYTDGGTIVLYEFGEEGDINFTLSFFFMIQDWMEEGEHFLTTENFTAIEPIEIEGIKCSRCAYVNEQGDTAAYVVEGIGFDSRDMGDLLTPFTRKPDPNADYQEWCGLSHVVKDGKIIYKGMRYREGANDAIDEVVADQRRPMDDNYYDLTGRAVGKDVPTTPGIYIHNGNKIVIR